MVFYVLIMYNYSMKEVYKMPKYMVVYNQIKDKIDNNEYVCNESLPSGEVLAQIYNCSVLTVKKALDMLVNDGYIVRKRGLGTFVKKVRSNQTPLKHGEPNTVYNGRKTLVQPGMSSIVETFDIIKCDEDIASYLNIQPDDFVYYIVRVRLYKDEARIVEYTWMPLKVIEGLELKDVEGSIYYYITKKLHLKIQSAHISFNATRPNDIEKKYFNMTDSDFVCEVEQTAYLDNSQIFEFSIARHVPKYFKFETNIIKDLY